MGKEEYLVQLDRIFSIPSSIELQGQLVQNRLFSLGQVCHYLFLLKLSMHFSRVQEAVHREIEYEL